MSSTVIFPAAVSEETATAGEDGSGVVCAGAETAERRRWDAERTTDGRRDGRSGCGGLRDWRSVMFSREEEGAATRMIAAAETRISVAEFDLVGCFGLDDGDAILAAAGGLRLERRRL